MRYSTKVVGNPCTIASQLKTRQLSETGDGLCHGISEASELFRRPQETINRDSVPRWTRPTRCGEPCRAGPDSQSDDVGFPEFFKARLRRRTRRCPDTGH